MRLGTKLILCAAVSLLVGAAIASPLFISDFGFKTKPLVGMPEGSKAAFSVELVYAKLNSRINPYNDTSYFVDNDVQWIEFGDTGNPRYLADYVVVLNVTNLSNLEATVDRMYLVAAKNISFYQSVLSDNCLARTGESNSGNAGGLVKGVWLDGEWINSTWIPSSGYPITMGRHQSPPLENDAVNVIPILPLNAAQEGTWIDAVPIAQYYNDAGITAVCMYINGTWVNVSGRVSVDPEQSFTLSKDTLFGLEHVYLLEHYPNSSGGIFPNTTALPSQLWYNHKADSPYVTLPVTDYNYTWAPHQSKLVMLNGSMLFNSNSGADALESGNITLYASVSNYDSNPSFNGISVDNSFTAGWLKRVQLEKTSNGYLYNTLLNENQTFVTDAYGIEVFIEPRS